MTTIRPASKAELEQWAKWLDGKVAGWSPVSGRAVATRIRLLEEIATYVQHQALCPAIFSDTPCTCGLAQKLSRLEKVDRQ